jgi:hypothetical protein
MVAAACAGVLGTLAHDVESRRYLEEAKTRHTVIATAVEGSAPGAPTPPGLAGANAVLTAAVAWWITFLIAPLAVSAVRTRTARMRDAQWEREIRCLVDDEDGRNKHWQ